ncbi:MAG: hypothetical protein HKO66_04535 [Saprospiraceae bacterium]|nr:hypothetical protein [Bacteroidia bacterium]NNE14523.1 hypothetical protein [Saprospiraceae bacterium]NNL91477.1 hypothetical protein [Saprospiraceae bacterium]
MKNLKPLLLIFSFVGFIWACEPGDAKPKDEGNASTALLDTISKQQFRTWVKNWAQNDSGYIDTSAMTYFNMPIVDLQEMLGSQADSVRLYIGLEELSTDHYDPHIMMVGMVNGSQNMNLILDYTRTCPPYCD